jgi:hypothetical protein
MVHNTSERLVISNFLAENAGRFRVFQFEEVMSEDKTANFAFAKGLSRSIICA